jgi:hypothetical protein
MEQFPLKTPDCVNTTDHALYVVYSTPGGVGFAVDTVQPGGEWREGAMECYYDTFHTREDASAYVQSFFGDRNKTDDDE